MNRRVLVGLWLMLGATCSGCGSGQKEAVVASAPASGVASTPSDKAGPSPAAERPGISHTAGEAPQADARKLFGARFAGVWLSRGTPPAQTIFVGVKNLTFQDRRRWEEETDYKSQAKLVRRDYSIQDLDWFTKLVTRYLDSKDAFCYSSLEPQFNSIKIIVPITKASQVNDEVHRIVPRSALKYEVDACHFMGQ